MKLAHGSAALCLSLACGAAQALPPDQVFTRAAAVTWQVRALGADEKLLGTASGIATEPGKLLTSCQALARARQLQLRRGSSIFDAKLEFPDVERDLCQLDVPGLAGPVPALSASRGLRPGQRLYVIGYGLGNAVTLGEGLVSAVHDAGAAGERIQTTIPAARGLLGAGVYDEEAQLVGVVTTSPKEAASTVFAVPVEWIPEVAARGAAALAARAKSAAAASGASSGGSGAPGMPAAGSTWVYAHVERQYTRRQTEVTVQVLRVDGQVVEEAVSAAGAPATRRVVNAAAFNFLEHPINASSALVELAPYVLAANGGKAPAALAPATSYPIGGPGLPAWVCTTRLEDWEQVSVPAGTFRALRIQIDGEREREGGARSAQAGVFKMTAWYAPEVKRIVRLEHTTWVKLFSGTNQLGHEVVELLSYRPPQ